MDITDTSGVLDEALQRLHAAGPERLGRLTNHAPMVAEALVARGRPDAVHRWLDLYEERLEEFPAAVAPVTDADWAGALGDPRRAADWIAYFGRTLPEHGWQSVLATWWPRLLPGMYGGSTHPVIRVGHAVRALLRDGASEPRLTELAHGLGYWAARHHPLAGITWFPAAPHAAASLHAVPPIRDLDGGFPMRLARIERLPAWAGDVTDPATARDRLAELVRAATHRYATHGHGEATMLVHAATAPSAVLRTLPALPRALWAPSLHAAWTASAAVTAMYAPAEAASYVPPGRVAAGDVIERAVAHGDEHVIKFADTALDVADKTDKTDEADGADEQAHAAVLRAIELSEPLA
ncbi:questin oxidase family protein [Streptomyces roseoverticillatus]|uniref:questin oxidase family protein n=1 Tax=Streptomyces roseoverticillatus TaxID=66429 RepID=UPI0004C22258|nr:questin oxidase family protein [Streptomyces roseoverticillatus]